jgi:hypothetical protein
MELPWTERAQSDNWVYKNIVTLEISDVRTIM